MWPWDELGLTPTGDERAIRKAYAERARQHRPDDDPERFIRLRAAYEAALAAAARIAATEGDGKVVRLDGFRPRPAETESDDEEPVPKEPPAAVIRSVPPPPEKPKPEPIADLRPLDEPPAREPVTPRNARVRIERVGENSPVAPPPPAAFKPKVRIERVGPEAAPAPPPSPPPARPKIRIERIAPPADDPKAE